MIQIQWSKHQNCFPYALEWAFSKYRNFRIIICRQRYVHWTEFGFRIQLFQNCQKNNITLSSSINFVWNRNPIWGKSCWPIRVFILDLINMRRILNINSFNKKFIVALVEGFNRLISPFQLHVLLYQQMGSKFWNSFYCIHDKIFYNGHLSQRCKLL